MSIRLKLTTMFLAIASIPLLFVSVLTFTNYENSLEANHFSQLQDLTIFRADRIEVYFAGLKGHIEVSQGFYNIKKNLPILTRLADDPGNQEFIDAKKMLDAQLQQMLSVSDLSDIMLVNPQGRVVYANRPGHFSKDMSNSADAEQKAFAEGKSRIYFSDVYLDKIEDNRFEMLLTAPATDFNGDFIGVIAFEIDMTPVYKLIQDTTGLGNTGEVLIGRKADNQVVYLNPLRHDPNATLKRKIDIGNEIGRPMQEAVQGRTGSGLSTDYRGKKVIAAWRHIPSLDWGLVAKIDTREAFADVTNLRNLAAVILVIVIVLSSITAFSIAHSISEPIKQLSEGAAIIGSGNLDYKIGTNLKDEIGQLSRTFDKMTLDLKQTTASRDELNREIIERKKAEDNIKRNEARLEGLLRISQHRAGSIQELLDFALDEAITLTGSKIGYIYHYNETKKEFTLDTWSKDVMKQCTIAEQQTIYQLEKTGIWGEAVRQAKPIIVNDFHAPNPLKKGYPEGHSPLYRFLTVPVLSDGHIVGVVGVANKETDYDGSDVTQLTLLMDTAWKIADRKRAEEALRESKNDLDRAQAVAHSGSWRLDVKNNKLTWSDEAYRIFGVPIGTGLTYEMFLTYIHPDDRQYVDTNWKAALAGEKYDIEHRIVVAGQIKWVRERAELEFEQDGSLLGGFGTVTDITARKEAEATLLREKNFSDTTIDSLPGVFYLFNEQGRFLRWNKNFEKVTEYSSSEMANIHPLDLFRGDNKKLIAERIQEVIEKGETIVETGFVTKSGLSIPYFFTGKRIMFDQKPCVVGMGVDITQRKKMEEELRKSRDELEIRVKERTADLDEAVSDLQKQVQHRIKAEETVKAERKRFEDVLEMMPAYAILLTPDYHVTYANRTFREWFGDDNGKKCYEFLFNRKEPCETCETYTVLKTGKSHFWEWTGPNGHNYDIYDYPFTDTDGSPLIMEIGVDVTAHKQAQKAVRLGEERYRSLTEATTQIIWTTDAQGQVISDMPLWQAFTGQTIEEIQGWGWINSLHPDDRERTAKIWTQSVQNKSFYDTEYRVRRNDGEYRYMSVRGVPVLQEDGSIREWVGTCTDITEKKAAEAELEKYQLHLEDLVKSRTEELVRSNRDLEQFAYVASHDLQEPLRAVSGFVELLRRNTEKSLDAKTNEYINFAIDGAKRMQSLINGLLEYSRIGTQGKKPQKVNSKEALDEALARLQASIKETGAEITADGLPVVYFDDVQLSQLFQNLIGNAIKFRSDQTPRINISAVRKNSEWQFAVTDNGIGIEPQYADRIFQIFQRLHNREKYPGTGIGLSICKKIVERHNGKIWVESKPEGGSTFYFTVPGIEEA